jgi:hypothetical protein
MLGFNATGRLDRVDFASRFDGPDFELGSVQKSRRRSTAASRSCGPPA